MRPETHTAGLPAQTDIDPVPDALLSTRISASYRAAIATPAGDTTSGWALTLNDLKAPSHQLLTGDDNGALASHLADPARSTLHYGFDELYDHSGLEDHGLSRLSMEPSWIYDTLRGLAEAVGVLRLEYPEAYHFYEPPSPDVEAILLLLDEAFGFRILFPNLFPGDVGLATSRGIATFRAIQSLFQAWRTFEMAARKSDARILEIGGGLGWTAYFAHQFGLKNYTIIDIPLSGAAQANFLGRVLGQDGISLFGEAYKSESVKIAPPSSLDVNERHDLGTNFDSFTEMSHEAALGYIQHILNSCSGLLSINHEVNPFTVKGILDQLETGPRSRTPYWIRRGYVEETARPVHSLSS